MARSASQYSIAMRIIRSVLAFLFLAVSAFAAETSARMRVAIVIDDGPDPAQNAAMLAVLADAGVHVTFSLEGRYVAARPDLARAVAAAGHEINNHSYTHPHMKELSDEAVAKELGDTQAAIKEVVGSAPVWFWPPFLESDARVEAQANAVGLKRYPWEKFNFIDSRDWDAASTDEIVYSRATTGVVDKTVILMHEWPEHSLRQLPRILAELKRQGAELMTFSELAASD